MDAPPRQPLPPPLPPSLPPSLPARKRHSPGRRWARRLVWITLGVVLLVRWLHPPDSLPPRRQFNNGRGNFGDGRQFRRPPTRVQPAIITVPDTLWRMDIQIAPAEEEVLRRYGRQRPDPHQRGRERPEVLVTVHEGGRTYTNVSLHLKGSLGSFRGFDDKPALTLNFSKHARGQSFHGFSKMSLNNSVQDPTYLSEALCRELFTAAGVPAPEATHATAIVNGRDLGLYVAVEGWGKPFLKKHFKDASGNLYEGPFAADIDENMEVNSGDNPGDHSEVTRLLAVLRDTNKATRWARLSTVLDVDRFATLLALEMATCHWDGYSLNRNNYRVFHDRTTDRLVFLPHGMDQMFGSQGRLPTTSTILPQLRGSVARAFMGTREGRKLFLERLARLHTSLATEEKLVARTRALAKQIQPTLAAYGPDVASWNASEVEDLCRRIAERCQSVGQQLGAVVPETVEEDLQFDATGQARPKDWKPRMTRGLSQFERSTQGGQTVLRITASEPGSASWRSTVILAPGVYSFQGQARLKAAGNQGGVRLRISGQQSQWIQASPERDWTTLVFVFEVSDVQASVELVCEFGDAAGQATFDEASLHLTRLGE